MSSFEMLERWHWGSTSSTCMGRREHTHTYMPGWVLWQRWNRILSAPLRASFSSREHDASLTFEKNVEHKKQRHFSAYLPENVPMTDCWFKGW